MKAGYWFVCITVLIVLMSYACSEPKQLSYVSGNQDDGFTTCTIGKHDGEWDYYSTCDDGSTELVTERFIEELLIKAQ